MDLFQAERKIVIITSPKLPSLLAYEVKSLRFPVVKIAHTHVETRGRLTDTYQMNLKLRTANRVLLHLFRFEANSPDALYQKVKKFNWSQIIDPNGYFHIHSYVKNRMIRDTRFANLKFKDAVADHFSEKFGARPDSGPQRSHSVIYFHWENEKVEVYLDTSGDSIARHNYRKISTRAPLMENLAAALIYASQWKPETPFINPMCGSGTLAIEAAMVAANIPPGINRNNYGFMHLQRFDSSVWQKVKEEARTKISSLKCKIIATDINRKAIEAAKQNAIKAGVQDLIDFIVCDFKDTPIPENPGTIILNPEYGERMGSEKELERTYRDIGDFFKQKCTGYQGFIFTGNLNLAKKVGLRTSERMEFLNGSIESRLLKYDLY